LGRVIRIQSGSRTRTLALREIAWTLREMTRPNIPEATRKDMAACILLSLRSIQETIEQAAGAWEKRDYWVKADHFRMEWRWVEQSEKDLHKALLVEDWGGCAAVAAGLAGRVSGVELPKRLPENPPWINAWKRIPEKS
jgi:hypothetical protein